MKFVLASHNRGKLKEMQEILSRLGVEVVLESDLGLALDVEETGTTFAENAALKAKAVMEASGLPAIGDDSGLCVDWLQGAPGIYSARYGNLDSDPARCALLLQNMRGATNRAAHFHTSICCAFPNGDVLTADGDCHGTIAFAPMGEPGLRLRSGVLCAGEAPHLRSADGGGEKRDIPPGQRFARFCRGIEGVFGEALIWN